MTTIPTKRTGGCLCGEVRYEVEGDPFSFAVCHCANCRKTTGSAFMSNAFFKPEAITITKGSDKFKEYRDSATTSGRTLTRTFCPECGSCLFMYNDSREFTIIPVGTLDEPVDWVPRRESRDDARFSWVKELQIEHKLKSTL
ncbi:hypothetical protein BDN72DRAFT_965290 [Pluteus cervinus]|uniref:Uncharacterized protein n=1 Tax=Pluteus cervinus TaxID=181527 RepID=A0ACD3A6Q0_9AGAR|nr:hypothetical protein BDN72DRAFT_965290 [Pluteus cervinus]